MATNPDELNALALRCEREEASRELDIHIAERLGWWRINRRINGSVVGLFRGRTRTVPPYTTSLDAAVSLVPEGMVAAAIHYVPQLDPKMPASGVARVYSDDLESGRCTGRTAALALCAAALRARAALAGDGAPADPPKVRE